MKHARTYNLALLGFGNVGKALARLFEAKRESLREEYRIEFRITGVATRRLGWIAAPEGLSTRQLLHLDSCAAQPAKAPSTDVSTAVRDWLRRCEADVLFETTSLNAETGQPAIDHLRAALESGAHAITANKGPVVHGWAELERLAEARGKRFLFESTVMDGAPIFSLFRDTLPIVELRGFRGVLNSTTNVILGEMENGNSLEEGIRRAQEFGVAESDPTDDLDGWDAVVKTCVLVTVLMKTPLKPAQVEREGISKLTGEHVRAARQQGCAIKLVCRAQRSCDGGVRASVRPETLSINDPLASVSGTSSIVYFETDVFPGLAIVEDNPGLDATAYGLLADFIRAVRS